METCLLLPVLRHKIVHAHPKGIVSVALAVACDHVKWGCCRFVSHARADAVLLCAAVGVFPFRTAMTASSMKMGYVEVVTQPSCVLFPPNCTVRGHVFHFSEILQVCRCLSAGQCAIRPAFAVC